MAALFGTIETIRFLLAGVADVNIFDRDQAGHSHPLHNTAYRADPSIVKLLLDSGAERDRKGICKHTPIYRVLWGKRQAEPHRIETINLLLDYGVDVNESGVASVHLELLRWTTLLRDLSLMQLLLDRGARVNPSDETQSSVLYHAAAYADYSTVQFLFNSGARVETSFALLAAASHGKIDGFNLILAHADEETISKNFGALHMAASSGHVSLVELMLNLAFDPEAKEQFWGNTPLHSICAASETYPDVVRLLLSRGADIDARNRTGDTPCKAAHTSS